MTVREYSVLPARRTVSRAEAVPPKFLSKKEICSGVGLPRAIVQATILPSSGTTNALRSSATLTW